VKQLRLIKLKSTKAQLRAKRKYREKNRDETNRARRERYANDPEYRERRNEWRKKNRDKVRRNARERYNHRRKETPWLLCLWRIRQRCNNPNAPNYKWYGGRGIRCLLTELEIEILYKYSHADQMRKPSIDRIDKNGDYYFKNCRFIEQSENSKKARTEQCKN